MQGKRVHITFDYELFFGNDPGTIDKCMIEPTDALMKLAEENDVTFVFFIDAGFIWQLSNHKHIEGCKRDLERISSQLKELNSKGHEVALHVHPHWEDSKFENGKWKIDTTRYKLSDYKETQIEEIVTKYHKALTDIIGSQCASFRAGGWCIQPFTKIKNAFLKNDILIDSSVYKNGYHQFTAQSYDFRNAPDKTEWKFDDDECKENQNGKFTEVAITPDVIPPTFYINLYLKMRTDPVSYKPIGNGTWLKDKKKIYRQFYSFTNHFACCDGYFASRLKTILLNLESKKKQRMLVLGHPKSMAKCSFKYLDEFIKFSKQKGYTVTTLHEDLKA